MLQHHNGGTGHQSIASASGGAKSSLQAGHSGKYLGLGNKTRPMLLLGEQAEAEPEQSDEH